LVKSRLPTSLLFFSHAFKRGAVRFTIHELAGVRIALGPCFCFRVVSLTALPYHPLSVSVPGLSVCGHIKSIKFVTTQSYIKPLDKTEIFIKFVQNVEK